MNQQVATQQKPLPAREVGMASGNGSQVAPQNLAEVVRFAEVMSNGGIALPKHLRGNPGTCMAVTLQALQWEMNPFAVAQKSYEVNGMIAYEAQLIAAVVNTRSGIEGRLKYQFEGAGDDLKCKVTGKVDGEILEYESPRKGDIKPQNSPLWKTDPQQQLGYYSARAWARRHTPEVLLGVYDRDEAQEFQGPDQAKDVTPRIPLTQRLAEAKSAESGEGFNENHVLNETSSAQGKEIGDDEFGEDAGQTSADADAPGDDGLPSEEAPGAEDQGGDLFPGDVEEGDDDGDVQDAEEVDPIEQFEAELKGCSSPEEVQALTDKFVPVINQMSKEDIARANQARGARLNELKGAQ